MNETELRLMLLRATGNRFPRHAGVEQLSSMKMSCNNMCAQAYKRRKTEDWLKANWPYVKESMSCEGNCASPENKCTDTQAHICYSENKNKVDPK